MKAKGKLGIHEFFIHILVKLELMINNWRYVLKF